MDAFQEFVFGLMASEECVLTRNAYFPTRKNK